MSLIVGHDGAKVSVGVADVDGGRIAALDVDRWGSSRSGNDRRHRCADRLTLPPETIPSCYRRMRHTEFQPHSGRHLRRPSQGILAEKCRENRASILIYVFYRFGPI